MYILIDHFLLMVVTVAVEGAAGGGGGAGGAEAVEDNAPSCPDSVTSLNEAGVDEGCCPLASLMVFPVVMGLAYWKRA